MVEQLIEKIKARGVMVEEEDYKDCLGCTGKLYTLSYGDEVSYVNTTGYNELYQMKMLLTCSVMNKVFR